MSRQVKCVYCDNYFSKEETEYVTVGNRYAHKECAEKEQLEQEYIEKIRQKMREVCGESYSEVKVNKQIKTFRHQGISAKKIFNTLIYWYDIKKNDASQANGGIGIVPYVMNEAVLYFKNEYKREQKYKNVDRNKIIEETNIRDNYPEGKAKIPISKPPVRKHFFDLK